MREPSDRECSRERRREPSLAHLQLEKSSQTPRQLHAKPPGGHARTTPDGGCAVSAAGSSESALPPLLLLQMRLERLKGERDALMERLARQAAAASAEQLSESQYTLSRFFILSFTLLLTCTQHLLKLARVV